MANIFISEGMCCIDADVCQRGKIYKKKGVQEWQAID